MFLELEDRIKKPQILLNGLCDWWPPSGAGGARSPLGEATNSQSGIGGSCWGGARADEPDTPPRTTEWDEDGRPIHLLKQLKGTCTPGNLSVSVEPRVLSLRHRTALAVAGVVHDVETNPGPSARGRRSRGEERGIGRREGRRVRRRLAKIPGLGGKAVKRVRDGCERVVMT